MPSLKVNPAHGSLFVAAYSCVLAGGPTVVSGGRTYPAGTVATVDRSSLDVTSLKAAGWIVIADSSGSTTQRPTDLERGEALPNGFRFLDTTLGRVVVWTRLGWVDGNTGAAG